MTPKKPYRPPTVKSVVAPSLLSLDALRSHIDRLHNDAGIEPVQWRVLASTCVECGQSKPNEEFLHDGLRCNACYEKGLQ